MLTELLRFRNNVHSQNGEDGVLKEILRRLEIDRGWFCEFGAWDGKYLSNTFLLLEQGWSGTMIEGDPARFKDLEHTAQQFFGRLNPIMRFVSHHEGEDSLDALLGQTPIPADFDVLSIDVDGLDYLIWRSVRNYNPKVVIIEVNSHYPPGIEHFDSGPNATSSFSAMIKLGREKGYVPVLHTGNVFFVRRDLIDKVSRGNPEINNWTSQFKYTDKSARGSLARQFSRFRQRVTDRIFYSHLRKVPKAGR
jgi:hypothetical protein